MTHLNLGEKGREYSQLKLKSFKCLSAKSSNSNSLNLGSAARLTSITKLFTLFVSLYFDNHGYARSKNVHARKTE